MKTTVNNNNIESKNRVYNAIIEAIKGDRMIGRHIAQTYGTNGPRPVYGIEVWESIVYVHTDTDRRIFGKAIDRLLKTHEDLFKWADFQKESEEGPHIVLALTDEAVKAKKEAEALLRAREISDSRKADGLTIGEGELVILKDYGGALGFITKVNGDELTFRHISGNWTAHPALDEVARIEDNRPAWCKKGQAVIYNGMVYIIEVVDFYADIEHSLESNHVCCICEQGKECICQNCRDVRWECLTPCTPDGRELQAA